MTWVAKCWRDYELPTGRTPESFEYKVEEIWDGHPTDTLYTDDKDEAERLVNAMLSQAYDAHVTHSGGQDRYTSGG